MKQFLILLFFTGASIICSSQDLQEGEGFVNVKGGRIWYKVIGDSDGIPLMAVHGGPGGQSCGSIEAFSLISSERPIILFDQLESGFSDRPGDTSLWKLPNFIKQVEKLERRNISFATKSSKMRHSEE